MKAPWTLTFILVLLLAPPGASNGEDAKKAGTTATGPPDLVWPLPPNPPRIRWLDQITSLDLIEGKNQSKRSWMARAAGAQPATERRSRRLQQPYGIAVDSHGRIYVADGAQHTVFVIDQQNRRVEERKGTGRAPLALPVGLALDEADRLFVSDSLLHSVLCWDADGKPIALFGAEKLGRAAGMALDRARHRLYVVDAKENRVAVFDSGTFTFSRYIGGPSTPDKRETGRFSAPTNAAVDRDGNLYVTDTWNYRVQVFDPEGNFVRAFGEQGVQPGNFVRPKGIAVDSEGHVYVADSEFNNIQIFTPDGRALLAVGGLGGAPGEFALLAGLCIDSGDRIYTTEQLQGRVQVFKYLSSSSSAKEVNRTPK